MRKITEKMVEAFINRTAKKSGNDQVVIEDDCVKYLLHGHCIASIHEDGLYVNAQGWYTQTTKDRLNGILDRVGAYCIYQKKGQWYFMNHEMFVGGWNKIY